MEDPLGQSLATLRKRRSVKWSSVEDDVIPLWIAEMDVEPCPAVQTVLRQAVADGDTGYAGNVVPRVGEALSTFTERRWGWTFPHGNVKAFADVSAAMRSYLRRLVPPGGEVVVTPPVYLSFFLWFRVSGLKPKEVPLLDVERGARLDFEGLEAAFADGARAMVLCSPHNPLGAVHSREDLQRLSKLAARYGVTVISDEIHAPLTYKDSEFVPYLTVSDEAAETAICVTSTSKGWNLAGLKAAFSITNRQDILTADDLMETSWGIGHLGLLAAEAVFADDLQWINTVIASIEDRAAFLDELLREYLPRVKVVQPQAGYLAWLDFRTYGLGHFPAEFLLEHARVYLNEGLAFGKGGAGHARLNFGTSRDVLEEAVMRMAKAVHDRHKAL